MKLNSQQIADLKASIAAKYDIAHLEDGVWCVIYSNGWDLVTDQANEDALDAEAEMEAIIQDEAAAAMEEME